MKITLRVFLNNGESEQVLSLDSSYVLIGRENAAVQVADPRCSLQHAMLFEGPDGLLWLKDLRSTNGTWVGNERISEARLELGASIRIGKARVEVLTFESDRDGTETTITAIHTVEAPVNNAANDGKVLPFDPSRPNRKRPLKRDNTESEPTPEKKRNAA